MQMSEDVAFSVRQLIAGNAKQVKVQHTPSARFKMHV